jgi:hypothetical protein
VAGKHTKNTNNVADSMPTTGSPFPRNCGG